MGKEKLQEASPEESAMGVEDSKDVDSTSKDASPDKSNKKLLCFGKCLAAGLVLAAILALVLIYGFDVGSDSSTERNSSEFGKDNPTTPSLPSPLPTETPVESPSETAPSVPTSNPSASLPTKEPTRAPTKAPTRTPTKAPTESPTKAPTASPTKSPTKQGTVTYVPGKLTVSSNGLLLSEGLQARVIAQSGERVVLGGGGNGRKLVSSEKFHKEPDGAAAYEWLDSNGGWIYVTNSEVQSSGKGGVGAIYFDKDGNPVDYRRLVSGTTANCSGGKTPWHSWVTCEETDGGRIYQVDPHGVREPQLMTMGKEGGSFESFAYDIRDEAVPRFFATEDNKKGALRRFTPDHADWDDPWNILHSSGTQDYLVLQPNSNKKKGTYIWSNDLDEAKENARLYYRGSEGLDVRDNELFFVSKEQKDLFILNLDDMTYEVHSTKFGLFDGQPDQVKRLIKDPSDKENNLLYFCEDGGERNGVHARDVNGWYFTILEASTSELTDNSGLAFSPNGKHMYVAYQHEGTVFDVWREDGLPFYGKTLSVNYHEVGQS
eukprot:scaffold3741_cov127-Cylindrotheca_fusiformis.AAC.1